MCKMYHLWQQILVGIVLAVLCLHFTPILAKNSVSLNTCCEIEDDNCSSELETWKVPPSLINNDNETLEGEPLTFDFQKGTLKCTNSSEITVKLNYDENENNSLESGYFTADGFFSFDNDYYSLNEYCVKRLDAEFVTLNICSPNCSDKDYLCIPKCCPWGQILDLSTSKCVHSNSSQFMPVVYENENRKVSEDELSRLQVHYHGFNFSCAHVIFSQSRNINSTEVWHARIRFQRDREMHIRTLKWKVLKAGKYCMESIGGFIAYESDNEESPSPIVVLTCPDGNFKDPKPILRQLFAAILILTAVFTFLTAAIYLLLWKTLNIHRWTQFFHVLSYCVLDVCSGCLYQMNIEYHGQTICFIIGVMGHYVTLSTPLWLVVINLDITLTLWKLKPRAGRKLKRLMIYCLFGWLLPAVIVIISLVIDFEYGNDDETTVITPEYGKYICTTSLHSAYMYMYIPTSIAYIAIAVLFTISTTLICKHRKSTKFASDSSTKHKPKPNQATSSQPRFQIPKDDILLFGKLALLSGGLAILQIFYLMPEDFQNTWFTLYYIHAVLDHLQGVAIFVIYICNRSTFRALIKEYPVLKRLYNCYERKGKTASGTLTTEMSTSFSRNLED